MKFLKTILILTVALSLTLSASCVFFEGAGQYIGSRNLGTDNMMLEGEEIMLPNPDREGKVPLEQAIEQRRSIRQFSDAPLDKQQISQLLWAAQGITEQATGYRASPSAGALYPLEIFLVSIDGVYHYQPQGHQMVQLFTEDIRQLIASCALGQQPVAQAPVSIIITAIYDRTTARYGDRGIRYTDIEAGHACQNILLQATALGLGAVPIGAFSEQCINEALGLDQDFTPLYVIPVGYPDQ